MQEMYNNQPRRSDYSFWWHHDAGYYCIVPTNCIVKKDGTLTMGAGLAKAVLDEYPNISKSFGRILSLKGQCVDLVTETKNAGSIYEFVGRFIMFPTKHSWRDKSTLQLIEFSTDQLLQLADEKGLNNIFVPKVGCGLGGLNWEDVESLLVKKLDERFVISK